MPKLHHWQPLLNQQPEGPSDLTPTGGGACLWPKDPLLFGSNRPVVPCEQPGSGPRAHELPRTHGLEV